MTPEEELEAELMAANTAKPEPENEQEETEPAEGAENPKPEVDSAPEESEEVESGNGGIQPDDGSTGDTDGSDGGNGVETAPFGEGSKGKDKPAVSEETPDTGEAQESVPDNKEPIKPPEKNTELALKGVGSSKLWADRLTGSLTSQFGDGYSVNELGMIDVSDNVDVPSLVGALGYLSNSEINAGNISTSLRYNIGKAILEISAREDKDISVVVSERNLCEGTGRSKETLYDWVNVAKLPMDNFHYGLTMSHYVSATKVHVPRDNKQAKEFIKKRGQILDDAAEDRSITSRDIKNRLYDVSRTVTTGDKAGEDQQEAVSSLWRNAIDMFRVARAADVNPDILIEKGITRRQLSEHIEYTVNELVNRNCITDSPENVKFYWDRDSEPIEVEAEVIPPRKKTKNGEGRK